ncbi:MAG TPA: hypothetical protein VLA93_17280 [Pyrinomonadaceae bacterium]|nr:hypothetical protein [Pyrinomonadaceae bacterium]
MEDWERTVGSRVDEREARRDLLRHRQARVPGRRALLGAHGSRVQMAEKCERAAVLLGILDEAVSRESAIKGDACASGERLT